MNPIGWTVCDIKGRSLLALNTVVDGQTWIPLREAELGLSGKGNVVHFECEENAVEAAKVAGGSVVALYANVEPPREREQCRAVGFPAQVSGAQRRMPPNRMAPSVKALRWVPIASPERPEPYEDVLLWNPCDGVSQYIWSGEDFYTLDPYSTNIGSATHWAVVEGPEPSDDVNINWKLYQGVHCVEHAE